MDIVEQKILQRHLARFMVREVFNTITDDDILIAKTPDIWLYKGKELNKGQIGKIRSEAAGFYNSDLWKMLRDELRYLAQKNTHDNAKTEGDLIAGKMLSYLTDVIDSRLKKMIQE